MGFAAVLNFVQPPMEYLFPIPKLKTRSEDPRVDTVAQAAFIQNYQWQRTKHVCLLYSGFCSSVSTILMTVLKSQLLGLVCLAGLAALWASTFFVDYSSPAKLLYQARKLMLGPMSVEKQNAMIEIIQRGAEVQPYFLERAQDKNCQHLTDYLVSIGVPDP